jgi:uncharacterized membrane protein YfcA
MEAIIYTCFLFALIATLYSSVGHAGASGYLAVMALLSFSPESIKPTSLILNIIVALITSIKFISSGYFDKKIFLAFIISSLPASFLGGFIKLDPFLFKLFAGGFLIVSGILLLSKFRRKNEEKSLNPYNFKLALVIGLFIGFFSGMIGVGGGIFLTPILIMLNWTSLKNISGISALFILLNSIGGLTGHIASLQKLDTNVFYWIIAASIGGLIGSYFGTKKFNNKAIYICLIIVLLSAGIKFIFVDAFHN